MLTVQNDLRADCAACDIRQPFNNIYDVPPPQWLTPVVPPSSHEWNRHDTTSILINYPSKTSNCSLTSIFPPTTPSHDIASEYCESSPTRRSSSTRSRSPNHIPRPRNAFMIFRSEFWAQQKITGAIEHDHRHISRIIAHCWNQLPEHEKQQWRDRALQEKAEHAIKYPNYRYAPTTRSRKPVKRNVKRNGVVELDRCRQVAELLLKGKQGDELENAVKKIDIAATGVLSPSSDIDETPGSHSSPAHNTGPGCPDSFSAGPTNAFTEHDLPVWRNPIPEPAEAVESFSNYRQSTTPVGLPTPVDISTLQFQYPPEPYNPFQRTASYQETISPQPFTDFQSVRLAVYDDLSQPDPCSISNEYTSDNATLLQSCFEGIQPCYYDTTSLPPRPFYGPTSNSSLWELEPVITNPFPSFSSDEWRGNIY